ncbi:MAG: deoxyguanosinetriphosphate triphosphohydrolase [Planctomycetes bacterium DG_23]|nr:MAG: deoxyguanosinetriphosphate triphosphohydrolase [Planctomycetes bacterium DG_23]
MRQEIEEREMDSLAPYAAKSRASHNRTYAEEEHPFRTAFQRDRDRVIHSSAFRRLEYKTQVFVNHEGDHYRTRLTHTMEVAQIARIIARALGLNEDLVEAVALAHDLGHTPFGHAGEDILRLLMQQYGGFEHNLHTLRVVDLLERRYPQFPGLNLTWEVRESIVKHTTRHDHPVAAEFLPRLQPLLEAQVVEVSDSIAYDSHDLDDGLYGGLLLEEELLEMELWKEAAAKVTQTYGDLDSRQRRIQTVRFIINWEVTDLVENSAALLEKNKIASLEEVRQSPEILVTFSPDVQRKKDEIETFLLEHLYKHYRVTRMAQKAKRFIQELFQEYVRNPAQLPPPYEQRIKEDGPQRVACDYIAGMTDRFALDEYKKLFDPYERV